MIRSFLAELHRRSPILSVVGWFHLAVLLGTIVAAALDSTQILGVNAWVKPAKFAISITIFLWTMAWYLHYLPDHPRTVSVISRGIAGAMVIEIVCICLQSSRGVASHFNRATPFDGAVFGFMGIAILASSILTFWAFILFFRQRPVIPSAYLWGIRIGTAVFLFGSWIGSVMVSRNAHTVGAGDGGPGLPFVNWSTIAGDLRIPHALGLHALQLLPLIGFALTRTSLSEPKQRLLIWALSITYTTLVIATYIQALNAHPLYKP